MSVTMECPADPERSGPASSDSELTVPGVRPCSCEWPSVWAQDIRGTGPGLGWAGVPAGTGVEAINWAGVLGRHAEKQPWPPFALPAGHRAAAVIVQAELYLRGSSLGCPHACPRGYRPQPRLLGSLSPSQRGRKPAVVLALELAPCRMEGLGGTHIAGPPAGGSGSGRGPRTLHFEPMPAGCRCGHWIGRSSE